MEQIILSQQETIKELTNQLLILQETIRSQQETIKNLTKLEPVNEEKEDVPDIHFIPLQGAKDLSFWDKAEKKSSGKKSNHRDILKFNIFKEQFSEKAEPTWTMLEIKGKQANWYVNKFFKDAKKGYTDFPWMKDSPFGQLNKKCNMITFKDKKYIYHDVKLNKQEQEMFEKMKICCNEHEQAIANL